jgi:hypothetical protein
VVPRYGRIDGEYGKRLATSESPEPVYMLSLMKYLPEPYHDPCGQCDVADFEPDGRFAPLPMLTAVGAGLCFVADVLAGFGDWQRAAVVGYPTRRAFVQMAAERDFQEWHSHKQSWIDRQAVLALLPAGELPSPSSTGRVLLEIWAGSAPARLVNGRTAEFDVEGTIVGDGQQWAGVRFADVEPGTPLPLEKPKPEYQGMLLEPVIERWLCPR